MTEQPAPVDENPAPERRDYLLLFGVLAGPVAWFTQLMVQYVAAESLCGSAWTPLLYVITLVALAVTAVALVASRRGYRDAAAEDDPAALRVRTMSRAGIVTSAFFLLVIAVQGIPALILDPCA